MRLAVRKSETHFAHISVEQAKKIAEEHLSKKRNTKGGNTIVEGSPPHAIRQLFIPCRSPEFSRRRPMDNSNSLVLQQLKNNVLREQDPEKLRELVVQIDSLLDLIEARVQDLSDPDRSS
jgi:hypothetical protein